VSYFRSRRRGRVHAEMPEFGARLLADLTRQLIELLSDGEAATTATEDPLEQLMAFDEPREAPEDPALLRLLPDAHRDDPTASAEFRRFTERALRTAKVRAAMQVLASIGELPDVEDPIDASTDDSPAGGSPGRSRELTIEFELDKEQARLWMRCLTDLRLTLAARLDVQADDEAEWLALPDDDPRAPLYRIYGWLGYQLESLLEAAR
jgi:hypothetical protein